MTGNAYSLIDLNGENTKELNINKSISVVAKWLWQTQSLQDKNSVCRQLRDFR